MAHLDVEIRQKLETIFDDVCDDLVEVDGVCIQHAKNVLVNTDGTVVVDMESEEVRITDFDYIMIVRLSDSEKPLKILYLKNDFKTTMFRLGEAYGSLIKNM